jgi:hypothetical protein
LLLRLAGGGTLTALALVGLWVGGAFPGDTTVAPGGSVSGAELRRADAAVETPGEGPYEIGLSFGKLAPDFVFSDYSGQRMGSPTSVVGRCS